MVYYKKGALDLTDTTTKFQTKATMFISFDMVNCTKYKSSHKGTWASGINEILKYAIHAFANSPVGGFRYWKIIGDEIAYTKDIQYMTEIDDALDEIYQTVVDMNEKIKSSEIGDAQTAKYITVKATVWIADISSSELRADNFYTEYKVSENQIQAEYLGTDIDTGFRIAKYTSSNRVVISYQLAALMYKESILQNNFHKVHYVASKKLKGIWEDMPFPIFMYHDDNKTSFIDSIGEDELQNTEIFQEYLNEQSDRKPKPPFKRYEEELLTSLSHHNSIYQEVLQLSDIIYKNTRI